MTDKELRRLNRMELIQLLFDQEKELERVQGELKETKEALESRKLGLENVGSIAEAALQINQVMEAAQAAADQYLENAQAEYAKQARQQYEEIQKQLAQLQEATVQKCRRMLAEAKKEADGIRLAAKDEET